MASTKRMKVSTRLFGGFAGVLVLLIMVSTISMLRMDNFNLQFAKLADDRVPKILQANEMIRLQMATAMHVRNMLIFDDPQQIKREQDAVTENVKAGQVRQETLQKTVKSEAGKSLIQNIAATSEAYRPHREAFMQLIAAGNQAAAKEILVNRMLPRHRDLIATLTKFSEFQNAAIQTSQEETAAEYANGRLLMVGLSSLAVLVGILAAWLITRSLLRQLGGEPDEAADVANRIAQGDLAMPIPLQPGDRHSLMFSMKTMRDDLRQIVTQVRQGTDTIATASGQIAAGNQDLSGRTEEQASSLEETASSMEELTSTVKQNADNARQASSVAAAAAVIAGKGGMVVSQVVHTMGEINESAKKIVDIISVIDGIAFQTNILALNAAVEAARAGEQGRGFAVVAAEVRMLAQRSANAAKEIKHLIHDSVEKVDVGSKLVDQAGSTMSEVVASVRRVTDLISDITAASQEQTAGIEQINEAVSQMDHVTQQNAALVEEAAAAACSLQDQASTLARVVSIFKLAEGHEILPTQRTSAGDRKAHGNPHQPQPRLQPHPVNGLPALGMQKQFA